MKSVIVEERLTDGSLVYAVEVHTLKLHCRDFKAAQKMQSILNDGVIDAETIRRWDSRAKEDGR